MTEIALAILAIGMFFIGYFLRESHEAFKSAIKPLKAQRKALNEPEAKSQIVEALSPEEQARRDMEDRLKRINGSSL